MRPEAEEYVGHYVKAVYDFQTIQPGELTLVKGDILKVTKCVDRNWLHGKSKTSEGNFPTDFVEKITIPPVDHGYKVFAAVENFPAQQAGDLEFRKGDVIIGAQKIDENWWEGQIGHQSGIFPLTHVLELEIPKLLRQRTKSVHSKEPLFARALCDSIPQLDEELGFQVGDIISVTEVIDEDWYFGELGGKQGMFLSSCVELLNEDMCNDGGESEDVSPVDSQRPVGEIHKYEAENMNANLRSSNGMIENEDHTHVVMRDKAKGQIEDHKDIIKERSFSYTQENTRSHDGADSGVTPYAKTLYPFIGELPDELSFQDNEIVTLIQHIDEQWIEGEIDGVIGVFPANYVEIIVDCPYAYSTDHSENLQAGALESAYQFPEQSANYVEENVPSTNHDQDLKENQKHVHSTPNSVKEEKYALVLYNFRAETSQDLNLKEGDTITVLRHVDENWLEAQDENGNIGLCPVGFVEIIDSAPEVHFQHSVGRKTNDKEVTKSAETSMGNSKLEVKQDSHSAFQDSASVAQKPVQNSCSSSSMTSSQSLDSISDIIKSTPSVKTAGKPALKPKPKIGPKPVIKPKPVVGQKPVYTATITDKQQKGHSSFSGYLKAEQNIPKSASTKSLTAYEEDFGNFKEKSQSMSDINTTVPQTVTSSSGLTESDPNCRSLTSLANSETGNRNSSGSDKIFAGWDMTKPLDCLVQKEIQQVKHDMETRSLGSNRSSAGSQDSMGSGTSLENKSLSDYQGAKLNTNVQYDQSRPRSSSLKTSPSRPGAHPNYSREHVYGGWMDSGFSVGNSMFFDDSKPARPEAPKLRKPPAPPQRPLSIETDDLVRKPSLRKPAPPRPVGPRPVPSPTRPPVSPGMGTEPGGLPPKRPNPPASPATRNAAPGERPRRHTRPAPPRPQPGQSLPARKAPSASTFYTGSSTNLMSFSPDASIDSSDSSDPEAVAELKTRIANMEKDLQKFKKSKSELEQMLENIDNNNSQEILDNIEFYKDNIRGLTAELSTLKDQLSEMCPQELDKLAQERAAEARRQQMEKEKEEEKKRLEEERIQRKEKRQKVINELIQTEKDYLASLNLIMDTFLSSTAEKHPEVDIDTLFGNIEEVADVSQKLLTKMEGAVHGQDFSKQVIGTCFTQHADDMKNVYAPYCRNHDEVISLVEKYMSNAGIKDYIDRLLDKMREESVVFDLEALLIKPVQRILKYPLLLNELIKSTEDSHPDKKSILNAINAMTDVATAINEYKRRKDLVFKYKKDSDESLGNKLSKFTLHSIKKKSTRLRERFSANLGFIGQTKDENFTKEEAKYRSLEKTVKIFVRDVQIYMADLQECSGGQEVVIADMLDFCDETVIPELQRYSDFHNKLRDEFYQQFEVDTNDLVISPLTQLMGMFEGPNKVIQKRFDKMLDYDNMTRKGKDDKTIAKAMTAAKKDYEALNAQLLDELPKLYTLAFQLFQDCVASFVRTQRSFMDKILHQMYPILDLQILSGEDIMEVFNIHHTTVVDRLAMLSIMPRNFSPRVAEAKPDKKSKRISLDSSFTSVPAVDVQSQSDSQRVYVQQSHPAHKLYRVSQTYIALDMMDLSLMEGDLVGVIKEQDPLGNKDRWFVDNGATKGFVPKKILVLYEQSPPRAPPSPTTPTNPVSPMTLGSSQFPHSQTFQGSSQNLDPSRNSWTSPYSQGSRTSGLLQSVDEEEMDFALGEDMAPSLPDDVGQASTSYSTASYSSSVDGSKGAHNLGFAHDEDEFYYAEYQFEARNPNEVTMFEHQVVTVLAKHDLEGNSEWWQVDADGVIGYAPALYLKKMESHGDPT